MTGAAFSYPPPSTTTAQVGLAFQRWAERARARGRTGGCCEGGSEIQPSQQEKIWIEGSALCAVLGAVWTPLAGALCEVLVPFLLDLGPVCAQCPPAPVEPDWSAMWSTGLLPTPEAFLDFVVATFISQNWNSWCQCIGGVGCGGNQLDETLQVASNSIVTGQNYPTNPTATSWTGAGTFVADVDVPWELHIGFFNADGTSLTGLTVITGTTAGSFPWTASGALTNFGSYGPATAMNMQVWNRASGSQGPTMNATVTGEITYFGCTNGNTGYTPPVVINPPGNIPPPPPQPSGCTLDQICGKVTYIEQELDNIYAILQRTVLPPRAWGELPIPHTLTGDGSFTTNAATLALKTQITTFPDRAGSSIGDPDRVFDVGWITAAGTEGPYQTWPIQFMEQVLVFPPLTQTVHYSIPLDVVINAIELYGLPVA